MTPNDLYRLEPKRTTTDTDMLSPFFDFDVGQIPDSTNTKVELQILADHCFDGRRTWWMATVWFEQRPFMVVQRAGREGDDHTASFVTDTIDYHRAETYLRRLLPGTERFKSGAVVDPAADAPDLTEFYSSRLEDFYSPNLVPRFKEGDVVVAWVPRNHLDHESDKTQARVKISSVDRFSPCETYNGLQLDRNWDGWTAGIRSKMTIKPNDGGIGAQFGDADVLRLATPDEDPFELEKQSRPR